MNNLIVKAKQYWRYLVAIAIVLFILISGAFAFGYRAGKRTLPTKIDTNTTQTVDHSKDVVTNTKNDTKVDGHSEVKQDQSVHQDVIKTHTKITKKDGTVIEKDTEHAIIGKEKKTDAEVNVAAEKKTDQQIQVHEVEKIVTKTETHTVYAPVLKWNVGALVMANLSKALDPVNLEPGVFAQYQPFEALPIDVGAILVTSPADIKNTQVALTVGVRF